MNQQDQEQSVSDKMDVSGLKVIHPVYKSADSVMPFMHALKLAQQSHGELEIVDVRSEEEALEHIGVRSVLERWGLLPPGAHRHDLAQLGLKVKKVVKTGNKRKEILKRIDKRAHDLLVIGTERKSFLNLFHRNLAEFLSESFPDATLLVSPSAKPFVNEENGSLSLNTILIPLADNETLDVSLNYLFYFLSFFPQLRPTVVGLHAGSSFPEILRPAQEKFHWIETVRSEPVTEAIVNAARIYNADVILMPTWGRIHLAQKFTGTFTEQVWYSAPCPVLSVPMDFEVSE